MSWSFLESLFVTKNHFTRLPIGLVICCCRFIEVTNIENGKRFIIPSERWLAVNKEDGKVHCLLPVATDEELSNFTYVFNAAAKFNLRNVHTWLSFMRRPPPSCFTRCQRLSVAVAILMSSLTASAMFYGAASTEPAEENRIGPLEFKWSQVNLLTISIITITVVVAEWRQSV